MQTSIALLLLFPAVALAIAPMAPMHLASGSSTVSKRGSLAFVAPGGTRQITRRSLCAAAIPGDSAAEDIVVGGLQNFFQIFNNLLIGRVLLSWFPAAQGVALLQPLFAVCDPYLNLFRGLLPPLGGIDFSPILAFTFVQVAGGSMVALGAEPSSSMALRANKPPAPWSCERMAERFYELRAAQNQK
mmetsp:Transcript_40719/g.100056  ORF Transcript_40719/g.100056 Transcript_40719/m.100056 type:complete len:187 (+) Transcript_40719:18-578(+)